MDDKVIIVSSDSHAGVPHELWAEYLPKAYHDLLPKLEHDIDINTTSTYLLGGKVGLRGLPEHEEAHRVDWHGLHDPVIRMADMDREGIAAELIYLGDSRLGDMFHNVTNRQYARDAWDAGARAWNRWAADAFGFAMERFLVTGAIGPCDDMDTTVAELEWIADHRFTGMYLPGYVHHADMPPLYDEYWEPFWSTCEARGLALVVHAGFGTEHGQVWPEIERIFNDVAKVANSTDRMEMLAHADAVADESFMFFDNFLNHSVDARRPMWQMMFGGVFDRHPDLRLVLTEIRLDWIPATLRHLDAIYENNRADLKALQKAERVLADQLPRRCLVHPQGRGRHAPRDRRRDHALRSRLPTLRGHLAPHQGLPPDRVQ
jgi:predicted TIM-barrel fold metal-dependent hydrolase